MSRNLELGTVLQELRGNGGMVPKAVRTVLIPPQWLYRDEPKATLLDEGVLVPEEVARGWGLLEGDEIVFRRNASSLALASVWGCTDQDKMAKRPVYDELVSAPSTRPRYPQEEWPIDILGNSTMRAFRAIAPIGPGSQVFVSGEWGTGKTWTARFAVEALLEIARTGERKMAFCILQAEERTVDLPKMADLVARYPEVLIRHLTAVRGVHGKYAKLNIAEMALSVVKSLYVSGYHVIYVVDSLSGLAVGVYGPHSPSKDRTTPGGVSEWALAQVARHTAVAGSGVGGRSVTGLYTALAGESGSRGGRINEEAGGPASSSMWVHTKKARAFPMIDISGTATRELNDILSGTPGRLELHEQIARWLGSQRSLFDAHELLLDLAKVPGTWEEAIEVWEKRCASANQAAQFDRDEESRQAMVNYAARLAGRMDPTFLVSLAKLAHLEPKGLRKLAELALAEAEKSDPESKPPALVSETEMEQKYDSEVYSKLWQKLVAEGVVKVPLSKFRRKGLLALQIPPEELERRIRAGEDPEIIIKREETLVEDEN